VSKFADVSEEHVTSIFGVEEERSEKEGTPSSEKSVGSH
jgi:hypothetical protein